ncbi:hypothetical protein ACFYQA_28200 [Streptomyces sp. NPDC005774]|uniref:hypothetical protein n=1 Tax=Streptomyces sp. NPDC005774 TaxID=3364728 RepID=UPI0036817B10
MSELLWDDVKGFFDLEWEGCLPDVWVTGTCAARKVIVAGGSDGVALTGSMSG